MLLLQVKMKTGVLPPWPGLASDLRKPPDFGGEGPGQYGTMHDIFFHEKAH